MLKCVLRVRIKIYIYIYIYILIISSFWSNEMAFLFSFELAVVDSHFLLPPIPNSGVVINSINGLNNVEIRANDAHGRAASAALLRPRRCPQFDANIFTGNNA